MIFHPTVAYGIAFAVVAFLTFCGIQNRRAGYRRKRYDLVAETVELWQSIHQEEVPATTMASPQMIQQPQPIPASSQDLVAYHARQLSQLQSALASAGAPAVRPACDPVAGSPAEKADKKDAVRVA